MIAPQPPIDAPGFAALVGHRGHTGQRGKVHRVGARIGMQRDRGKQPGRERRTGAGHLTENGGLGTKTDENHQPHRNLFVCIRSLSLNMLFSCEHLYAASLVSCSVSAWAAARKAVMILRPCCVTL